MYIMIPFPNHEIMIHQEQKSSIAKSISFQGLSRKIRIPNPKKLFSIRKAWKLNAAYRAYRSTKTFSIKLEKLSTLLFCDCKARYLSRRVSFPIRFVCSLNENPPSLFLICARVKFPYFLKLLLLGWRNSISIVLLYFFVWYKEMV